MIHKGAANQSATETWLLPLVVISQILLYAAINGYAEGDGFQSRYRYPVQPLITLVMGGGVVWLFGVGARLVQRRLPIPAKLGLAPARGSD